MAVGETTLSRLVGTMKATFGIGPKATKATLSAGGLTAARTFTLPDATGTVALVSDITAALPAGTVLDFAGTSVPTGFLACDGSAVSRTTYATLFTAISTTWGAGNGSTTFNVPDFRRRVAVGSGGTGSGTLGNATGNTGGAETHTLSSTEMPAHTHSPATGYEGYWGRDAQAAVTTGQLDFTATAPLYDATFANTGSTGGGVAHNNIQPSAVVTKIIKT